MKAWRLEAQAINKRIAEGSKEPRSRVQMQQQRMIDRAFKPKGSGSWLLDGLLLRGGFKAAVYGDPLKTSVDSELSAAVAAGESFSTASTLQRWVDKAKAWWNKGQDMAKFQPGDKVVHLGGRSGNASLNRGKVLTILEGPHSIAHVAGTRYIVDRPLFAHGALIPKMYHANEAYLLKLS